MSSQNNNQEGLYLGSPPGAMGRKKDTPEYLLRAIRPYLRGAVPDWGQCFTVLDMEGLSRFGPCHHVASDTSNHGTSKLFPLSVRYYTPEVALQTKFLDLYEDIDESAATIHSQITTKIRENDLHRHQMVHGCGCPSGECLICNAV